MSQAGGATGGVAAEVFSRRAGWQSSAEHGAVRADCTHLAGMAIVCSPRRQRVGKGFAENREQTRKALQQFALTFPSYSPSSHWRGTRSSQGHTCDSHTLPPRLCTWGLVCVSQGVQMEMTFEVILETSLMR